MRSVFDVFKTDDFLFMAFFAAVYVTAFGMRSKKKSIFVLFMKIVADGACFDLEFGV